MIYLRILLIWPSILLLACDLSIKKLDLMAMKRLENLVCMIPIIGKADTMTVDETEDYVSQVITSCMTVSLLSFNIIIVNHALVTGLIGILFG